MPSQSFQDSRSSTQAVRHLNCYSWLEASLGATTDIPKIHVALSCLLHWMEIGLVMKFSEHPSNLKARMYNGKA